MAYLSFFTNSVAVPVWLLLIMIIGLIPLFLKLIKLVNHVRKGEIVREEHSDMVLWRVRAVKPTARPKKSSADVEKERNREKKDGILHVLQVMAEEGDKGMLLQAIADRMKTGTSKVQQAVKPLVDKKLVDEVTGVSGTKYYLTEVGKKYCIKKGYARSR
jgi:hypothetical protein